MAKVKISTYSEPKVNFWHIMIIFHAGEGEMEDDFDEKEMNEYLDRAEKDEEVDIEEEENANREMKDQRLEENDEYVNDL